MFTYNLWATKLILNGSYFEFAFQTCHCCNLASLTSRSSSSRIKKQQQQPRKKRTHTYSLCKQTNKTHQRCNKGEKADEFLVFNVALNLFDIFTRFWPTGSTSICSLEMELKLICCYCVHILPTFPDETNVCTCFWDAFVGLHFNVQSQTFRTQISLSQGILFGKRKRKKNCLIILLLLFVLSRAARVHILGKTVDAFHSHPPFCILLGW